MKPTLFRKNLTVLVHVLAWLLVALALFVINPLSWRIDLPMEFWVKQFLILTILIWSFYGNILYVAPKFLFRGNYWQYLFIVLFAGLAFVLILQKYDSWVEFSRLMHEAFRPGQPYVPRPKSYTWDIVFYMQYALSIGISTSIAAVHKWQLEDIVRRQLEEQKKLSELSYLKAQINPHFFFNTLNNIYALINFDVEQAKTALLKLSRMMRYVLYETEKDKTFLSAEISFIKDYISLMQIRVSEKVKLDIQIQEKFDEVPIAPMMILPFVENCFKHGVSGSNQSYIKIHLHMEEKRLILVTENKITDKNQASPETSRKGIGLTNTLRRLSLLYKNKHILTIDDTNPERLYRVNLSIDLT
ncbi:sensor histidine kinase [Lunatimonas salinarum]|uniref:sensor histidine kinase n=1 Tax=Lunatimonas salinarum TaxID=1774590 RepID=UPI001ADEC497|nr:histidine kinase [Lunatimonas salinarum]